MNTLSCRRKGVAGYVQMLLAAVAKVSISTSYELRKHSSLFESRASVAFIDTVVPFPPMWVVWHSVQFSPTQLRIFIEIT